MNVQRIPIDQIEVGERRREELGDIRSLGESIRRIGLLHPIVVDWQDGHYRLVAGARRLRAIETLGWDSIDAQLLGTLSAEQLRDIELEENQRRKGLTPAERSKTFRASKEVTEDAGKAAEVLSTEAVDKPTPRGHESTYGVPKKDVAEAIGVGTSTLVEAEQHVELAERYPWLQSDAWVQADVLKLRRKLKRLTDEEQTDLCQFMEEAAAPFAPRPDRVLEYAEIMPLKTPAERDEIYRLWQSKDDRDRSLARTRALHRPPMPDVRSTFIEDAVKILKKAVKPPFHLEPESAEFRDVLSRLKALDERLDRRYQELKSREAHYVETDLQRREAEAVSA